jgi:hypothetical protein
MDPHEAVPYMEVMSEYKPFRSDKNSMLGRDLRKVAYSCPWSSLNFEQKNIAIGYLISWFLYVIAEDPPPTVYLQFTNSDLLQIYKNILTLHWDHPCQFCQELFANMVRIYANRFLD